MTREMIIEQLERHRQEFAHDHGWNTSVLESLDAAIKVLKQEPCEDAISRNLVLSTVKSGLIRVIDGEDWKRVIDNASEIRELPSVQPEQKMGRWIFHKPFDNGHKNCNECIECSQCHTWLGHDCYAKTPYCPMCGAKMQEVE